MITKEALVESARRTLVSESVSIAKLAEFLDDSFVAVVELLFQTQGRLVVTGIGKSAIIAQKIVATLNSTGTPALFLHASEAIHGDLGMVQPGDPVLCISKSGNSPEIKVLVPLLKRQGNVLIGMTGNPESYLGKASDYVLNTWVERESDPNNLAPTNSTTAQLAMGDAIAVCLIEMRHFTAEDFALYHPGGALGKKLLLKVNDLLDTAHRPVVEPNSDIKQVIVSISEGRLGVTAVLEEEQVIGIITDGDIRRMLNKTETITGWKARDIMTINPKTIAPDTLVVDALNRMEQYAITQLVVVEGTHYLGVIHLHDILKEGVV
ncbi:SIS domain-containing protein [Flavobacterium sp.]|uniref:KpsF/GutQ family sugar-phosphate isomerase n=1 Tax=Flavobacterium sp. TaxID=239 RepID=UPI002637F6BA|nr:KpsF/GutQ family sugar-phosphate isomerase [Flavobacterium sp.]